MHPLEKGKYLALLKINSLKKENNEKCTFLKQTKTVSICELQQKPF